MITENGIVHYLSYNNNLIARKKDIIHFKYKDLDFYILDEDKNEYTSYVLYKDSNNEYWMFYNSSIAFERYNTLLNRELNEIEKEDYIRYCDFKYNEVKGYNDNMIEIFNEKIKLNKHFNIVELGYLEKNYPELYPEAVKSRETFLKLQQEKRDKEREEENNRKKNIVKTTNKEFLDKIINTKIAIHEGKTIITETLEYYKDDDYDKKTIQNNFLYLLKEYKIDVPLSTQGFINQKLYSYNFETGESKSWGGYKGTTLYVNMDKLKQEIDKEFSKNKELNEHELEI